MQATVAELNAAFDAYNLAAGRLGWVVLAPGVDRIVRDGDDLEAEEAITGCVIAGERLMQMGAWMATKVQQLVAQRPGVDSPAADRLPDLLELALAVGAGGGGG